MEKWTVLAAAALGQVNTDVVKVESLADAHQICSTMRHGRNLMSHLSSVQTFVRGFCSERFCGYSSESSMLLKALCAAENFFRNQKSRKLHSTKQFSWVDLVANIFTTYFFLDTKWGFRFLSKTFKAELQKSWFLKKISPKLPSPLLPTTWWITLMVLFSRTTYDQCSLAQQNSQESLSPRLFHVTCCSRTLSIRARSSSQRRASAAEAGRGPIPAISMPGAIASCRLRSDLLRPQPETAVCHITVRAGELPRWGFFLSWFRSRYV